MKKIPKISQAEWQVMKLLWAESPSTANRIVDELSVKSTWKPKTVRTLLNRLVKKKAAGYKKKGREYHYYPLVTQQEYVRAESHSFLDRVYDGTLTPMLAAFVDSDELSPEDIKELKRILDEKEKVEREVMVMEQGLTVGMPVRIIREPYFGQLGKVSALPVKLTDIETEAKVRVLEVELEDQTKILLPRANVEIIEE